MNRRIRHRSLWQAIAAAAALTVIAFAVHAQRNRFSQFGEDEFDRVAPTRNAEFHFIRLEYNDLPQFHRGFGYSSRAGQGSGWW